MDYCSTCRRHLNGALVCPGCGAYAPDIAPATADGRIGAAPFVTGTAGASQSAAWDTWQDGRLRGAVDEVAVGGIAESVPQTDESGDLEGVPAVPQGRAARRRQRARWKKNQRRAVVATAVALVGGGLTVASTHRQSGDRTQTATAATDQGAGAVEKQAAQDARSTSTQPDAHRSSPTPPAQSPAPDLPHPAYATDSLHTTPSHVQPDAAAPPRTATVALPQPQSAATSSAATVTDRTDTADTTATTPAQTPAPAATDGTDPGSSPASPEPAATSPSQICLLVLCLG
ncbi:hypothetical protein ACFWWT_45550 [Streptomyces sp. NPDC058676]|uniref:SCO2400 family protein n=1 Tax=unclassified Streptomyces TaxID=2593676 RepID=UPI003650327E